VQSLPTGHILTYRTERNHQGLGSGLITAPPAATGDKGQFVVIARPGGYPCFGSTIFGLFHFARHFSGETPVHCWKAVPKLLRWS